MTREEKNQLIDELKTQLKETPTVYLADISGLNAETTSNLRRKCHAQNVVLRVVKNTLLKKAMEQVEEKDYSELFDVLTGNTSLMLSETGNTPAKIIKEFRKKNDKPVLKAAYVEEAIYIGDNQLDALAALKSREELIGEIITLLQSPVKTVMSQLQSGGDKLAGIVKTLSEKAE